MSDKTNPNIKESKFIDYLQYSFTPDELDEKARIMSEQQVKRSELEVKKKAVTSEIAAQINKCSSDLSLAAQHYRDGWEMRDVTCIKRLNYDTGMVERIRTDTGEIYKSRQMEGEELKMPLPIDEAEESGPIQ